MGNLYIPFLTERDFGYADAPFPFMLGMHEQDYKSIKEDPKSTSAGGGKGEKKGEIKDGTYIIDLDNNGIWQQPHTSVILSTSGTTKDISIDDLPDLPNSLQAKL